MMTIRERRKLERVDAFLQGATTYIALGALFSVPILAYFGIKVSAWQACLIVLLGLLPYLIGYNYLFRGRYPKNCHYMDMTFDWQTAEQMAYDWAVQCVETVHKNRPDERIYAVIFYRFYGDGANIYPPKLTVCTQKSLTTDGLSFNADDDFCELCKDITWYAKRHSGYDSQYKDTMSDKNFAKWMKVYQQFCACFDRACERAVKHLVATDSVEREFVAFCNRD